MMHTPKNTKSNAQAGAQSKNGEDQKDEPVSEQKKKQKKKEEMKKINEELKVIKIQLDAVRRKLNRVQTALKVNAEVPNPNLENRHFLQLQLKTIEDALVEYNANQQRIYSLDVGDEAREEADVMYVRFEQRYGELYVFIIKLLDDIVKKENVPVVAAAPVPVASAAAMHLPPLKVPLPTFDGTYENWYAFKSMFETIMNRYQSESPAIKLYHLRNSLVGKAAGIIDQEIINNNDYAAAWSTLTERFEDKRLIIDKHIDALFDLPRMTSENATELRKLIDVCSRNVDALKNLELPVEGLGESMLINRITKKLDDETRKAWELDQSANEMPDYDSTMEFLKERCRVLEKIRVPEKRIVKPVKLLKPTVEVRTKGSSLVATADKCPQCSNNHALWKCDVFKKANLTDRYNTLRRIGACFNYLQKGHRTVECSSEHSCKQCNKRHHTFLHPNETSTKKSEAPSAVNSKDDQQNQKREVPAGPSNSTPAISKEEQQSNFCTRPKSGRQILLSTAVVLVYGKANNPYPCRVLLDSGSHTNFVSEHFATLLGLKKQPANFSIGGLNETQTKVRFKIHTQLKSRVTDYTACLELLVVPKITGELPVTKIDSRSLTIPGDPNFGVPDKVDMLLGAEIFFELLKSGRLPVPNCAVVLQETNFGWVLSGSIPDKGPNVVHSFCVRAEEDIGALVKRFWEIEAYCDSEIRDESIEEACMNHFRETHERTAEGRYVVRVPFNDMKLQLGDSRTMAERRFLTLEKRLDRAPELKEQYMAFLREYEQLGHMKLNNDVTDEDPHSVFYLPHHYVLKPSSTTTRLRVVFDGSAESSTGISINQTQMIGPTVQNHLVCIVSNFRVFKYGFTADVPKMYRQVGVHRNDRRYQKVVNRYDSNHPLQTYDLQTVTYGLASSPFLATMALLQLANDEEQQFPLAAAAVRKSFYIDDVLTGANTLEEALELKNQIIGLLKKGCFSMHKFCSNSEALLEDVPENMRESVINIEDPTINAVIKTLGVAWQPQEDCFTFVVPVDTTVEPNRLTKRLILSQIAKIFDPLGFVGPVVTAAKLIMRELWSLNLDWDEPVPTEMANLWTDFRNELHCLNELKIPRWILSDEACAVELHGFADASDLAYGACLYSRLVKGDGSADLKLICSKSRILPRKKGKQKEITTPRAELLAAQLLARLTVKQLDALDVQFESVVLWSDSQIVLCWLRKSPDYLAVYVGNRVREIQRSTDNFAWKYIPSKSNPADTISRGIQPKNLKAHELWWNGPPNLRYPDGRFDEPPPIPEEELPDLRSVVLVTTRSHPRLELFDRISRYSIIQRTMAYVVRFCDYVKNGKKTLTNGLPTVSEMTRASTLIVRMVQNEVFESEISTLKAGKEFKFPVRNLNPFVDESDGVLRVGGRLKNAAIPYQHKHQALLPEKHPVTVTLIRYLHRTNMHIGQRGLLGIVRQQYWPLNAKNLIRKLVHQCVPCFRTKPTRSSQLMGNLPDYRVQPSPVFAHTGIDFAGPFKIRSNTKIRNAAVLKGYVCVFVCMATRALHLEAVSDLTSEGFMGALQRFVSRRGLVVKLYSDDASNFEGANNEMNRLATLFQEEQHQLKLNEFCAQRAIEWSFIPPRSPHFGGIWEAGVKSVKSHLKLIMAEHKLSFEQFATVLTQIEAVLNSRPLVPVSDDQNDINAITPAHFLIGREFQGIQEPSYEHIPQGRLSQWQLVQDMKQKFWKLWMRDYLHELQKRPKDFKVTDYQVGALVLIVDENTPPLQWQLARIIELHPGKDGHTRVVSLRTKDGTTKRAVKKICLLPLDNERDQRDE